MVFLGLIQKKSNLKCDVWLILRLSILILVIIIILWVQTALGYFYTLMRRKKMLAEHTFVLTAGLQLQFCSFQMESKKVTLEMKREKQHPPTHFLFIFFALKSAGSQASSLAASEGSQRTSLPMVGSGANQCSKHPCLCEISLVSSGFIPP